VGRVSLAIDALFARYATALSADDLASIASCFDPPVAVVADESTVVMVDRAHVKEYFVGMADRYRAQGAFIAVPMIHRVEQLTSALWLVDIRWDSLDRDGAPTSVAVETCQYLLRASEPDQPLIVAAIVTS
jgi:hypothetical protein